MKTTQQAFSGNPFVNIFRSAVANLRKETLKRVTLILFVLLCILIRFRVVSTDKNLARQNKRVSLSVKNQNQPLWPSNSVFRNEVDINKLLILHKAQGNNFGQSKKSLD